MNRMLTILALVVVLALTSCKTWHPLGIGPKDDAQPPKIEAKASATAPIAQPEPAKAEEPAKSTPAPATKKAPDPVKEELKKAPNPAPRTEQAAAPATDQYTVYYAGAWRPLSRHGCTETGCKDMGKWVYAAGDGQRRFLPTTAYRHVRKASPKPEPAVAPAVAHELPAPAPAPVIAVAAAPTERQELQPNNFFRVAQVDGYRWLSLNPNEVPGDRSAPFLFRSPSWRAEPIEDQNDDGWWDKELPTGNYKLRFTYGGAFYPEKAKTEWSWATIVDAPCCTHHPDLCFEVEFRGDKVYEVPCHCDTCRSEDHDH